MTRYPLFVTAVRAAFIGNVSAAQMNRLVDEALIPEGLFAQDGRTRRFVPMAGAFAKFFFDTETVLAPAARKQVLAEVTLRAKKLRVRDQVFALRSVPEELDWTVGLGNGAVLVDVSCYIAEAMARAKEVDNAEQLITENPEVLGGLPCFAGTRVPIENVMASLGKGVTTDRLFAAYPFLTNAHLAAAAVFAQVHPRRGRPRRLSEHSLMASPRLTGAARRATVVPGKK